MTRLALLALLLATPAAAQDDRGLIWQGADLLLRGLIEEAAPAIDGLAGLGADVLPTFRLLAQEMGPAFVDVFGRIDAIENYEPPVLLPDGDIVIRRRPGAPPFEPGPAPEVEL